MKDDARALYNKAIENYRFASNARNVLSNMTE